MLQFSKWKVSLVALAAIFGILFTVPNLLPKSVLASLPSWVPAKTLNLGLDLQGGSSLLLEADTADLKKTRLTNLVEDVRNDLNSVPIHFSSLGATPDTVIVTIDDPANVDDAFRRMQRLVQPASGGVRDLSVERNGQQVVFTVLPDAQKILAAQAVSQAREIVGRRIDALGTKEPSIETQGSNRILVEAPGEADPQKLKDIIGQTAQLSFQMVDDSVSPQDVAQGLVPPGDEILPYEKGPPGQGELVKRRKVITGDMITSAVADFDQQRPARPSASASTAKAPASLVKSPPKISASGSPSSSTAR